MCMEASGTYCLQVFHGKEQREKQQQHRSLEMNFMCVFTPLRAFFLLCCWFTTLVKDSRHAYSLI